MTKRTIAKIPISPGTPVRVEDFKYVDQGLEWNMQNEFDMRDDHLQASRVINWEVFKEVDLGLDGWTPGNSLEAKAEDLILADGKAELYIDEGIAYIGGRGFVRDARNYIDNGVADPGSGATKYNIYLKYTEEGNEFAFLITASTQENDHLIKYLLIATTDWDATNGWSGVADKRASNTVMQAPATISGNSATIPTLTVENEGAGLGLLVRLSDTQIGEDGTPQILTIWGTSTTGLTLKESGTANAIVLSCDAAGRMKVAGDINVTGTGTVGGVTLNAGAVSGITTLDMSGTLTGGTWEGTAVADAYVANDITLDNLTQITTKSHTVLSNIGTKSHSTIDTHIDATNIHYLQSAITMVGTVGAGTWQGTQINSTYLVDVSQPLHSGSSPTFVGLALSGTIATPTTITTSGKITSGTDVQVGSNYLKDSGGITRITLGTTTTIGGDIQIGGNDIKDSDGFTRISFDPTDNIDFIGPFACDLDPYLLTKNYDMGTNVLAWDECYADNWNNVSCWKPYADPLTALATFRHMPDDVYETDYENLDDWVRTRVKCKVKDAKGKLKWESGYVLKSGHEKAGARKVYDEKQKKNVKVGNYADGYADEDFERERAYSLNKAQVVLIQAVGQLKDKNDVLEAIITGLESRITTLESAS